MVWYVAYFRKYVILFLSSALVEHNLRVASVDLIIGCLTAVFFAEVLSFFEVGVSIGLFANVLLLPDTHVYVAPTPHAQYSVHRRIKTV